MSDSVSTLALTPRPLKCICTRTYTSLDAQTVTKGQNHRSLSRAQRATDRACAMHYAKYVSRQALSALASRQSVRNASARQRTTLGQVNYVNERAIMVYVHKTMTGVRCV